MSPEVFLIANVIVFVGFFLRGFTGFGAVLFTLPLLAFWMPVKMAVPLLALLALANGLWLTWQARASVDRTECGWLLLGGLPGLLVGLLAFQAAPDRSLRVGLGVAVVAMGLWLSRRGTQVERALPPSLGVGAGLAGGVLGGLFGLSGPAPVLYLSGRPLDREAFRATLLCFLTAVDVLRGAGYVAGGTLGPPTWLAGLALCPVSILASWSGDRLQRRVSEHLFRRAVGVLLALMGVALALSALRR